MAIIMTLKKVLDGNEGQQELSKILSDATTQIKLDIQKKAGIKNVAKLQKQLNDIFYPKDGGKLDYVEEQHIKATENELIKVLENFNFEENTSGYHPATTSISPNTLQNVIIKAQQACEALSQKEAMKNNNAISTLLQDVKAAIDEGNNILATAKRVMQFDNQERIVGDSFQKAITIINQLKAFLSLIVTTPTSQEAGILFEKALAKTNYVNDVSEEVADELLEKVHFGSTPVQRGVSSDFVSYTVDSSLANKKAIKSNKNFKINDKNLTITYSYNPNAEKFGKMDVQLNYGKVNNKKYRVSAKRWSHGKGDFGSTSIDAGMTRAVGRTVMEAYKLAVLTPRKDWSSSDPAVPTFTAVDNAHQLAVLALKSDLLMGLNQRSGYANLLVVDTGTSIVVKNLADLVLDDKILVSKYNEQGIQNLARAQYNAIAKVMHGRTSSYLGLMTSALNKMKVTVNYTAK